jgi:hypothetical protein
MTKTKSVYLFRNCTHYEGYSVVLAFASEEVAEKVFIKMHEIANKTYTNMAKGMITNIDQDAKEMLYKEYGFWPSDDIEVEKIELND